MVLTEDSFLSCVIRRMLSKFHFLMFNSDWHCYLEPRSFICSFCKWPRDLFAFSSNCWSGRSLFRDHHARPALRLVPSGQANEGNDVLLLGHPTRFRFRVHSRRCAFLHPLCGKRLKSGLGQLGHLFGWRNAFLFTGLPGIFIAVLVFFIKDPGMGAFEPPSPKEPLLGALKSLAANKVYISVRVKCHLPPDPISSRS